MLEKWPHKTILSMTRPVTSFILHSVIFHMRDFWSLLLWMSASRKSEKSEHAAPSSSWHVWSFHKLLGSACTFEDVMIHRGCIGGKGGEGCFDNDIVSPVLYFKPFIFMQTMESWTQTRRANEQWQKQKPHSARKLRQVSSNFFLVWISMF